MANIDPTYPFVGLVLVLGFAGAWAARRSSRNKARETVKGRAALTDAAFAALFTNKAEADLSLKVRELLKPYIPVDPALVRPDDKLCEDLQLAAMDGLDANAFLAEVEKVLTTTIPAEAAGEMLSIKDIVSYVAAHRQSAI